MDDWITVRQAAQILGVATQRIYTLTAAGTLSSRKQGLTRMVNKRSVMTYKESPTRNKFAGGNVPQLDLFEAPHPTLDLDGPDELEAGFDGCMSAPTLSVEARRLYDVTPTGARDQRDAARAEQRGRGA